MLGEVLRSETARWGKVVQAAGRVIRTQQDQGVVYLIDDRFAAAEVRELLPAWWEIATAA